MSTVLTHFYKQGQQQALVKLGLDANMFVQAVNEDTTQEQRERTHAHPVHEEKPMHWSGAANIQGGDTGTRNEQMGLPRSQAV